MSYTIYMICKQYLVDAYLGKKKSVSQIAIELKCSQNKVTYWLQKYNIRKRTISEGVYLRSNPAGNPFTYSRPRSEQDWFLYGLGLGLFWGEGNKVNKNSVRLGNTDPDLIKTFLLFLKRTYKVDENKLRFGLQIFNDIKPNEALIFWSKKLRVPKSQFQKVVITKSFKKGTYRKKSEYGVLTVYFSNTKLRDIITSAIAELREWSPS